ncbi:hypothetical protein F8568_045300 [Actinomadura sp. LD22]|uniref:DDE Tnp4 domain-containing protein n=1 Tax=Actinomadura physcomitrii TaxID=2650748 RepID=A0A6I4MU10_9ACTN|nr:hypothetical protein [Actinomadura physcomitrii]
MHPVPDRPARPTWASPVLPGPTHDPTAARIHGVIDALTSRSIVCYTDKGHVGAGDGIGMPYKRRKCRPLGKCEKLFNRSHAQVSTPGEQGAATLKS